MSFSFLLKRCPPLSKVRAKSIKCNFQYFFFNFGFGTKRHMFEPVVVRHVAFKYRQIKLMARVQQLDWWLNPYSKSDNDTGRPSFMVSVVSQVLVFEFKGLRLNPFGYRQRNISIQDVTKLRCFDTGFRRPYRYFSIALKGILSLSDRYKIFASD